MLTHENNRKITKQVEDALNYMAKVGFISKSVWRNYFSKGSIRWSNMQLKKLVEMNILAPHPCKEVENIWVLGKLSRKKFEAKNVITVYPPFANQLDHDEAVAAGVLRLYKNKFCIDWSSELEIKMYQALADGKSSRANIQKYPDALLRLPSDDGNNLLAIEYEKNPKSHTRYQEILRNYMVNFDIQRVLYIAETKTLANTILRYIDKMRSTILDEKIYVCLADNWKENPLELVIWNNTKRIKLNKIFTK